MKYDLTLGSIFKNEMIRRYVVGNSFDGSLTMLGIIIANFFAGVADPNLIVLPGIGAAVALGISGTWGAYSAEISEVIRKRKGLEKHLLIKIGKSKTAKKREKMALVIGIVNGFTSVIISFLILTPFFITKLGLMTMGFSYMASLILITIVLFGLGMFTGHTAKESLMKNGFKMLFAGAIISTIFFVLAKFGWI